MDLVFLMAVQNADSGLFSEVNVKEEKGFAKIYVETEFAKR